jgi:2,3-bisphosphoglycerate-independent phosphoglycerate mutase
MEEEKKPSISFGVIFILIDGLADNGMNKLDHKTPLQDTPTPYLDAIAYSGLNGIHDPVQSGLACGSDTAHMNIFGYDPFYLYKGRGK